MKSLTALLVCRKRGEKDQPLPGWQVQCKAHRSSIDWFEEFGVDAVRDDLHAYASEETARRCGAGHPSARRDERQVEPGPTVALSFPDITRQVALYVGAEDRTMTTGGRISRATIRVMTAPGEGPLVMQGPDERGRKPP